MSDDNVIEFPKFKTDGPPQSRAEVDDKVMEYKLSYSEEISEFLWRQCIAELSRSGCDLSKDMEKYFPSMILILEAIRSLHLQTQDVDHPLQDFAKDSLNIGDFEKKMVDIDEDMD